RRRWRPRCRETIPQAKKCFWPMPGFRMPTPPSARNCSPTPAICRAPTAVSPIAFWAALPKRRLRPRPTRAAAAGLTGSRRMLLALTLVTALAAPAASAPAAAPETFQFALPNGMQVLVIPDHRAPVVTQMLFFKVGGVDDPP